MVTEKETAPRLAYEKIFLAFLTWMNCDRHKTRNFEHVVWTLYVYICSDSKLLYQPWQLGMCLFVYNKKFNRLLDLPVRCTRNLHKTIWKEYNAIRPIKRNSQVRILFAHKKFPYDNCFNHLLQDSRHFSWKNNETR